MLKILLGFLIITSVQSANFSFKGKIQSSNDSRKTVLLAVKDSNIKFFKRDDELFFYNELNPNYKCRAIIETSNYHQIRAKVSEYNSCSKHVGYTVGSSVRIESKDLAINIDMAQDVVDVLLKKKLILENKLYRLKNEIQSRDDKKDLINNEYEAKMNELRLEWREALENVGLSEQESRKEVNDAKLELVEIDKKLKLYNVESQKLRKSQWSLKYDVIE